MSDSTPSIDTIVLDFGEPAQSGRVVVTYAPPCVASDVSILEWCAKLAHAKREQADAKEA